MKQQPSSRIGLRIRTLRESHNQTQESLAAECRRLGFTVSRVKLAKYEIGMTQVPARFIPVFAHVLKVDIADLLPPLGGPPASGIAPGLSKIRNLTGQQIQILRKERGWSQNKLAGVVQEMGVPMTREIIANLETRRARVKDYQLVIFAKALGAPLNNLFSNGTSPRLSSEKTGIYRRDETKLSQNPFAHFTSRIGKFIKRFLQWRSRQRL